MNRQNADLYPNYFNGSRRLGEAVQWMGTFNGTNWVNSYNKPLSEERAHLIDIYNSGYNIVDKGNKY